MYIISFFNNKGGVGKTTSVVAVASQLVRQDKRVLVVDSDPQANCSDTAGVYDGSEEAQTIYNLLTLPFHQYSEEQLKSQVLTTIQHSEMIGCDVLPSNILLDEFQDQMSTAIKREFRLDTILRSIRDNYDYCLIDCQPSLSLLTTNALVASNSIIIPCDSSKYALTGMKNLLNKFNEIKASCNPNLEILGILNTKVDNRYKTAKISREKLKSFFGDLLFDQIIPKNASVEKSQYEEKSVFSYGKKNPVSTSYSNLTKELVTRAENHINQIKVSH